MVGTLLDEERVPIAEVCRMAGGVTPETVWRWRKKGFKVPGSEDRIKLATYQIGGRIYTSREEFSRFITRVTEMREHAAVTNSPTDERSAATSRRLAEAGLT